MTCTVFDANANSELDRQQDQYLVVNGAALLRLLNQSIELQQMPLQRLLIYAAGECDRMGLTAMATTLAVACEDVCNRLNE